MISENRRASASPGAAVKLLRLIDDEDEAARRSVSPKRSRN